MISRLILVGVSVVALAGLEPRAWAHDGPQSRLHELEHELRHHPRDPKLWSGNGEQLRHLRRWDEAERALARAASLGLDSADLWYLRGANALDRQDFDVALERLDAAVQRDPTFAAAFADRARTHLALAQPQAARSDFQRAFELRPRPDEAIELSRLLAKTDPAARAEFLDEALAQLHGAHIVRAEAMAAHAAVGNHERVIMLANAGLAQVPDDPDLLLARADAHLSAGNRGLALRDQMLALSEAARRVEHKDTDARRCTLAKVLLRLGQVEQARAQLDVVLARTPQNQAARDLLP